MNKPLLSDRIGPDEYERGMDYRQKVFDGENRMIRQGVGIQTKYRGSETLPPCDGPNLRSTGVNHRST